MLREKIQKILEETASDLGYSVYESSVYLKGENSRITVKIDRLEGISHGDCEIYSSELAARLDEDEILPKYFLEISSPGLDRKLRSRDDFERFTGSPVKIVFTEGGDRKFVKGIINGVNESGVEVTDENKKIVLIRHEDINHANLDY